MIRKIEQQSIIAYHLLGLRIKKPPENSGGFEHV